MFYRCTFIKKITLSPVEASSGFFYNLPVLNLESNKAFTSHDWYFRSCAQLFKKEKVDRELNNNLFSNEALLLSVSQ